MRRQHHEHRVAWRFEELLAMIAAAAVAWDFCLVGGLSWEKSLLLIAASAILIGGLVYSLLALRNAGRRRREAFMPLRQPVLRPEAQVEAVDASNDPYPHHEHYPESAGEDQGQLTSHLPGSTPFLEKPETVRRNSEKASNPPRGRK